MQKFSFFILLLASSRLFAHPVQTHHLHTEHAAYVDIMHQLFALEHGGAGWLFILAVAVAFIVKRFNIKR